MLPATAVPPTASVPQGQEGHKVPLYSTSPQCAMAVKWLTLQLRPSDVSPGEKAGANDVIITSWKARPHLDLVEGVWGN